MPENNNKKWLFVLLNKGTGLAAWWLKITSLAELFRYLEETDSKWVNAFDNFLHDSEYQPTVIGHGRHAKEAGLTQLTYYYALNRGQSFHNALFDLAEKRADAMMDALYGFGAVYVNASGGWNVGGKYLEESGSFCHKKNLVWPGFTENQIRVTRFEGGTHWYAFIGDVQIRDRDRLKFDTKAEAYEQARKYVTDQA